MQNFTRLTILLLVGLASTGCTDLELTPEDRANPDTIFSQEENYTSALARVYAGLAVTGQQGPAGAGDISSVDEGFGNYLRQYWQLQELPTETAVIAWGDAGVRDLHEQTWSSDNQFVRALYYRIFYQVSQANEFLRETTDDRLAARGIREAFRPTVAGYRAEARFLRALSYWHGIDLFGDVIFYTEANAVGGTAPAPRPRAEIYRFLLDELAAIENELPAPGEQEYGRADRGAVWMLRAKLYQNAGVYTGAEAHGDALAELDRLLNTDAYTLDEDYLGVFLADNHLSPELIFSIPFDGERTQGFGGMTYLTHAPVGGNMDPAAFGINGGWSGLRTTPQFVGLFPDGAASADGRALFFTDGQSLEVDNIGDFSSGYAITKYRNVTSDGLAGSDPRFADNDFPLFRLGDAYLMYAESALRSGSNQGRALELVNALRRRAYGDESADLTADELTLDFLLAERGRELYWEGHRRTDRIRFDRYSDEGVWAWKGGIQQGQTTGAFRDLYPIPASELVANPNLSQNDGY